MDHRPKCSLGSMLRVRYTRLAAFPTIVTPPSDGIGGGDTGDSGDAAADSADAPGDSGDSGAGDGDSGDGY